MSFDMSFDGQGLSVTPPRPRLSLHHIHYIKAPNAVSVARGKITGPQHDTLKHACLELGVEVDEILRPSRVRGVVRKRWAVMALLRQWGRSNSAIGRHLRLDHTTVWHGLNQFDALVSMGRINKRGEGFGL